MKRAFPWIVLVLAVTFLLSRAVRTERQGEFDLATLGKVPVSADGRVKPLDTVARTSLMIVSGRQSLPAEVAASMQAPDASAMRWLLDVVARNDLARQYPVMRVDHPEVLALLDRGPQEGNRLSMAEIMLHWQKVSQQATAALEVPHRRRTPFQRNVIELYAHVNLFMMTALMEAPYSIPPLRDGEQWRPFNEAFVHAEQEGVQNPAVQGLSAILTAYHDGDAALFNREVAAYAQFMQHVIPRYSRMAAIEVWFNRVQPFYQATVLYVLAFLMVGAGMMASTIGSSSLQPAGATASVPGGRPWSATLLRAAFWLLVLTFIVHTLGLALRIYLQGRPPVTNLYSSAVFVGWACVLLALLIERWHPLGFGSLCAAIIGCLTLIIAHNLASGDTMEMMQAVLDSNFWLATHVITITIGYSATFLAGFLGILFILLGVLTRRLTAERRKALSKMVYGVICFALLLSFIGTVLGGIWADQSWGRFWGWDPKENGAALIVLIHAIILHARWGGMIATRGMMVLAVAGNIVTSWSWFGTNMLGVGLHSYGFMESAVFWLFAFVLSQFAVMALGMLPMDMWRSLAVEKGVASEPAKEDKLQPVQAGTPA